MWSPIISVRTLPFPIDEGYNRLRGARRYSRLSKGRSLSTAKKVLIILIPLVLISCFLWYMADNYWYNPPRFYWERITVPRGEENAFTLDLAGKQRLVMYFYLTPDDAAISVIIGRTARGWTDYQWVGIPKDYPRIEDGSKIVFKAPNTDTYTIWMRPRANRSVDVRIAYGFSE